MSQSSDLVWERAVQLLDRATTWHVLRRTLEDEGLVERLGPAHMQRLLAAWHIRAAAALTDAELVSELRFWGDGGTYAGHLRGFQAVPPDALVRQAQQRGWFVCKGDSGNAIVNPPEGRPVVLHLENSAVPARDGL